MNFVNVKKFQIDEEGAGDYRVYLRNKYAMSLNAKQINY